MLQDAHRAQELSGDVTAAVKDERWGDADRHLRALHEITSRLLREVGDKTREELMAPKPDRGDRG